MDALRVGASGHPGIVRPRRPGEAGRQDRDRDTGTGAGATTRLPSASYCGLFFEMSRYLVTRACGDLGAVKGTREPAIDAQPQSATPDSSSDFSRR
jgi:hypothetical protein